MEKLIFTGKFTFPSVGEVRGKLALDGTRSSLQVWSENNALTQIWYEEMHRDVGSIKGTLDNQNKVSLINCLALDAVLFPRIRNETAVHKANFFPHYVVFGDRHISHEEEAITGVSFILEDADILFHDPEVFGEVTTSGESLNARNARSLIEQTILSKKTDSDIPVGKSVLLYHTGSNCIFETDTSSEKISAERDTQHFEIHRTPSEVRIDHEVSVKLNFDPAVVTFDNALKRASRVSQFLELLIGRSQNFKKFTIFKESGQKLRVCGNGFPKYDRRENESRPRFCNVLIKPAQEPEEFSTVLKNWLERDDECRAARNWFFSYFDKQQRYDPLRIIRAADMFNHLHDVPGSSNSSRKKIRHCAERIIEKIGDEVPDLETVAERAVFCRNYYVHAKRQKDHVDYEKEPVFRVFLTNTLEFVFVVSDLIKAGWDVKTWWETNSSSSYHPVGRYLRDYKENLEKWKHCLFEKSTA